MAKTGNIQTTPVLEPQTKKSTLTTQLRIQELSKLIVEKGYGRNAIIDYAMSNYGISHQHASKMYYASLRYLMPDNPDEYREALINRNFEVLENMLQKAIDREDLSAATQIVKLMNSMLGAGDKKIAVQTEDTKIVVTFGD